MIYWDRRFPSTTSKMKLLSIFVCVSFQNTFIFSKNYSVCSMHHHLKGKNENCRNMTLITQRKRLASLGSMQQTLSFVELLLTNLKTLDIHCKHRSYTARCPWQARLSQEVLSNVTHQHFIEDKHVFSITLYGSPSMKLYIYYRVRISQMDRLILYQQKQN